MSLRTAGSQCTHGATNSQNSLGGGTFRPSDPRTMLLQNPSKLGNIQLSHPMWKYHRLPPAPSPARVQGWRPKPPFLGDQVYYIVPYTYYYYPWPPRPPHSSRAFLGLLIGDILEGFKWERPSWPGGFRA